MLDPLPETAQLVERIDTEKRLAREVQQLDEPYRTVVLLRSEHPYQKWREFYRFDGPELIQPALVRRGPRKLGLFFRCADRSRRVWRSFSSDDGRSWSSPVQTALPNPLSGVGAFFRQGRDTVVYNPSPENRHRLALSHSSDGGASWSPSAAIGTSP